MCGRVSTSKLCMDKLCCMYVCMDAYVYTYIYMYVCMFVVAAAQVPRCKNPKVAKKLATRRCETKRNDCKETNLSSKGIICANGQNY